MAASSVDPITGQPVIDIVLPTFRMEPEEDERFYPSRAKVIAENVMKEVLEGMTYDEEESKFWSTEISDKVREAVTGSLGVPRFKVVVQTTVGQLADQGVRIASRCLWDVSTDNYATASYKNVCDCNCSESVILFPILFIRYFVCFVCFVANPVLPCNGVLPVHGLSVYSDFAPCQAGLWWHLHPVLHLRVMDATVGIFLVYELVVKRNI